MHWGAHFPTIAKLTGIVSLVGGLVGAVSKAPEIQKGIRHALTGWQVRRPSRKHRKTITPDFGLPLQRTLVSREDLLKPLIRAYEQSEKSGCIAWISGESGFGKSCLIQVLLEQLRSRTPSPFVLSVSYSGVGTTQSAPYMKLLDALQGFVRKHPETAEVKLLENYAPSWYADVCEQTASGSERPQNEAAKILQITDFFRFVAERRPFILILDDVHWADNATLRLLGNLLGKMNGQRIFVLAACQSEYASRVVELEQILDEALKKKLLVKVSVERLRTDQIKRVIELRYPNLKLPGELSEMLETISEGNALFLENLLTSPATEKFIQSWRAGTVPDSAVTSLRRTLPGTLMDLIAKRFRTLSQEQRALLDQAAFQGPVFDSALLATASGRDPTLLESELRNLDMVHHLIARIDPSKLDDGAPNESFRFRHGLYLEFLRGQVLAASKAEYARRMALAQEKHNALSLSLSASRLAELYRLAGLPDKECAYLVLSAEASLGRAAFSDALVSANAAQSILSNLPASREILKLRLRRELVAGLATAMQQGYASSSVKSRYLAAIELAEAVNETQSCFKAISGLWLHELVVARLDEAYRLSMEMSKISSGLAEPYSDVDEIQSLWAVGVTTYFQGNLAEANRALSEGVRRYRREAHKVYAGSYPLDPGVSCRYLLGRAFWLMGKADSALRETTAAVSLAEELGHTESRAFALASDAVVRHLRGEPQEVLGRASEVRSLGRQDALSQYAAWASILEGWALSAQGDTGRGLLLVEEGLAAYKATGSRLVMPSFIAIYAECLLLSDRPEEALDLLDAALIESEQQGQHYADAELLRWSGEASLRISANSEGHAIATERFEHALAVARAQGALGFQLRAASSLARISATSIERLHAHEELSTVMGAVKEGHETHDYIVAAALLNGFQEPPGPSGQVRILEQG